MMLGAHSLSLGAEGGEGHLAGLLAGRRGRSLYYGKHEENLETGLAASGA